MNRLSLMVRFMFVLALLLGATAVLAQDALPDLGGRTITVAIENAYPPFNYLDEETGEAIGWDYDALNEICSRINCVPEFVETSWDGMIVAVSNGEFDMAADGITITEERAQIVDFSIGYIKLSQRLMVRIDEDRFSSIEEFVANPDYTIAVQVGTTNFITAQELVGDGRLVVQSDFGAAVQSLIAGDVDGVIIDDVAGQGYVGVNADQLRLLEGDLTSEELGFIYPQGSDLKPAIDAALMSMMEDGTLADINARWFSEEEEIELPDLGGRTITIAIENSYPPFNFIDQETGLTIGWDYDAITEICSRINCTPEFVETSWDGMIVAVSNSEFDMAADGITITEERAQIVDFSIGFIRLSQKMMVRMDEDRFSTVEEFVANPEFTVAVQFGTTNYITAEELVGESRLVVQNDFGAAVQSLIAGDVDAVIIDDVAGQGYIGVNADQLRLLDEELTSEELGFVFPLGSDLKPAFDAALMSMMADGTLAAINTKWFSEEAE